MLTSLSVAGCVDIEGGAVEARWVFRSPRGNALGCDDKRAQIASIRFKLAPAENATVTDDPCADNQDCVFPCSRGVGTTRFFVPEGTYSVSLQPMDADGNDLGAADGVTLPSPLVRRVNTGELTNVNVYLIIVDR